MGAISQVSRQRELFDQDGNKVVEAVIGFTGTYATGGDTLSPALFGMTEVRGMYQSCGSIGTNDPFAHTAPTTAAHGALVLSGTTTAPLVQVWAAGAQVANGVSLTARQARVRIVGR
jgi:hypothetical protein